MNGAPEISACLLCFNDEPTIAGLVGRAGAALDTLGVPGEVVVIDDGSTDRSVEVLESAAADEPRLRIIRHAANRGYGGALRSAIESAEGDWFFYTDGDGQYDPRELEQLAGRIGPGVEWVQGYKGRRSDSAARRFVGTVYGSVMRLLFALPVRDVDCDFRLIRTERLRDLELGSDSGAICVELVRGLSIAGLRPVEVQVSHFERLHGRSQFFRPLRILHSLWDVAALWARTVVMPVLRHRGRDVRPVAER